MTITVNIHEAKTQLSKLIQRALRGEEVIIARDGLPVVRLTPVGPEGKRRADPGVDRDLVLIKPDFDDPLDEFENL